MSSLSKQKGAEFERLVCKALSRWVSRGRKEDIFWRSAMSGGRATVQSKAGQLLKAQCGDISAISKEGFLLTNAFFIECKFYKDLGLGNALIGRPSALVTFFNEAFTQAAVYKKTPLLICKQNGKPVLVCTSFIGSNQLKFPVISEIKLPSFLRMRIGLFDTLLKIPFGRSTPCLSLLQTGT